MGGHPKLTPMRLLVFAIACLACLSACAGLPKGPEPLPGVSAEERLASARVDSLLAVPSDSLRSVDVAWLSAYAARRTQPAAVNRERGKTVFTVIGVGVVAAVALFLYTVQANMGE